METKMKIAVVWICSWCPDAMAKTKTAHDMGRQTTHGICPTCQLKLESQMKSKKENKNMKMIVRIRTVDMDGHCGRDNHPTREMEGQFARVMSVETFSSEYGVEISKLDPELRKEEDRIMVFYCNLVDANGDDVEGGEVDLMEFEIEQEHDVPKFFHELRA